MNFPIEYKVVTSSDISFQLLRWGIFAGWIYTQLILKVCFFFLCQWTFPLCSFLTHFFKLIDLNSWIHQLIYVLSLQSLSFMKQKDIKNNFFTFTSAFDGGYSDWSACSECSVTCGGGTQTFIRTCVPLNGVVCSEPNEKTEPCNEQDCRKYFLHQLH